MSTREEIQKSLLALTVAYPNYNFPEMSAELYIDQLSDLDTDVLKVAVMRHIATSKWFPAIAELRDAAALVQMGGQGLMPAGEAWGLFRKRAVMCGYFAKPDLSDYPVIDKTVQAMGLRYLMESDNVVADRARFSELYETYAARALTDAKLPPALRAGNPAFTAMQGLAKQLGGNR